MRVAPGWSETAEGKPTAALSTLQPVAALAGRMLATVIRLTIRVGRGQPTTVDLLRPTDPSL
eukprot:7528885-Prorocentrum_lima.AAC.1